MLNIFYAGKRLSLRLCLIKLVLVILFAFYGRAHAGVEFLSIAEQAVIMYNAPSRKAEKLYVASRYLPVEAIVHVEGWVKVRDSSGSLAWLEKKALSNKRYVIVTVPLADVHQTANVNSGVVFQVRENVVLELLSADKAGWVKIRHRDGLVGYIRINQVWGV